MGSHVLGIIEIPVLCSGVFCLRFLAFKIFVVKIRHLKNFKLDELQMITFYISEGI